MMIFTIEEHSLCLWIHISRTSNSVGFRSPTQFELAFKSSSPSSSLTELGPLFRHPLLSVFLRLVPRVHFAPRLSSLFPLSFSNLCAIMDTGPSVVEPTSDPEEGNATAGERHDTSPENIATWSHSRRRMRLVQTLLFHCTKNRAYVLTVRQFDIDSHLLFGDCIRNIFRVKSIKIYVVLKRHSVRAGRCVLEAGSPTFPPLKSGCCLCLTFTASAAAFSDSDSEFRPIIAVAADAASAAHKLAAACCSRRRRR